MRTIFISYARENDYVARRLNTDLKRGGHDSWLDRHEIEIGDDWLQRIEAAIQERETFFYLWSPEASKSRYVQHEYEIAQRNNRRIVVIRVAGDTADVRMPAELRKIQYADLSKNYWMSVDGSPEERGLRELLRWLGSESTDVKSADDFRGECSITMQEARELLEDEGSREWPVWNERTESWMQLVSVPVSPSSYARSWLVAEKSRDLRPQNEMQVVLKFTGEVQGHNTVKQVLQYLVANNIAAQVLYFEGLQIDGEYELPNNQGHIWESCAKFVKATIGNWCENTGHYFLEAPQALVFSIAAGFHKKRSYRVYTLNENSEAKELYSCVFRK